MRGQVSRNSLPGAVICSTQAGEAPHRVPASATAILAIPAPSTANTRRPRHGSHPSRTSKLTSAAIDAGDFLRARDQGKTQAHLPGAAFECLRYPWSAHQTPLGRRIGVTDRPKQRGSSECSGESPHVATARRPQSDSGTSSSSCALRAQPITCSSCLPCPASFICRRLHVATTYT